MRAFLGYSLDFDQPINLRRLTPAMKIYAGVVTKIHESKMYQVQKHKRMEALHAEQVKKDEMLKSYLLAMLYRELTENRTLGGVQQVCAEVVISVKSEYRKSLKAVLGNADFAGYNITEIEENRDIRKAFSEMPILLRVSKSAV